MNLIMKSSSEQKSKLHLQESVLCGGPGAKGVPVDLLCVGLDIETPGSFCGNDN